jgi:hypothetical protein
MSLAYLAQDADHQRIEWLHGGIMSVLLDGDKTNGQLGRSVPRVAQPHRSTSTPGARASSGSATSASRCPRVVWRTCHEDSRTPTG